MFCITTTADIIFPAMSCFYVIDEKKFGVLMLPKI